jgi:2-polyprenyl-3-methyl-5-hydroxy-6-metoxy-1,4-benzoquinol methylase
MTARPEVPAMAALNTVAEVRAAAADLYRSAPVPFRLLQGLRPYICPFEELLRRVPPDSEILDVGCGAGLFLGLLAQSGRLRRGLGFDISPAAIDAARAMADRSFPREPLEFRRFRVGEPWPEGTFDVVCMIDVLHHIEPAAQRDAIEEALDHVRPGGCFLYKDMSDNPAWQAGWNRLHDLVLTGQWIRYRPVHEVREWVKRGGFSIAEEARYNRGPYGHEMIVAIKRAG